MNVESIHREILTDQIYQKIGQVHSIILVAYNLLSEKQIVSVDKTVVFDLSSVKLTPFGKVTIRNYPGYFLKNNVEKLSELKNKLELLHPHLDTLKRDSKKLTESYQVDEYTDLIQHISIFYQEHAENVSALLDVIEYLQGIDVHAPAIFFSYPQWSSTQISDRYMKIKSLDAFIGLIDRAADIVSGIRSSGRSTYDDIKTELEADYADSVDHEHITYFAVSETSILVRTSRKALVELATYFEKIRVCCENIISEINELCDGSILENKQFLELFVKKSMEKTLSETTLWDFKQTFPVWLNPTGKNKEKFVLRVSSFANNKGGILIAGITDDRTILGIPDIEERVKQTKNLLDKKIENNNHEITVASLPMETDECGKVSCLLILIPQNCEYISVTKMNSDIVYPYRDGVETKYKSLEEMKRIKTKIIDTNFRFARELIDFVFNNGIVG